MDGSRDEGGGEGEARHALRRYRLYPALVGLFRLRDPARRHFRESVAWKLVHLHPGNRAAWKARGSRRMDDDAANGERSEFTAPKCHELSPGIPGAALFRPQRAGPL